MARQPTEITDAELAVMQVLWEQGPATIRQLTDVLYPGGSAAQYATVQKLLERLENKGHVRRDRSQSVHVFAAAVARGEVIGRRLRSVAEALCGGSMASLVTHLVRQRPLSPAERAELRRAIEELDRDSDR